MSTTSSLPWGLNGAGLYQPLSLPAQDIWAVKGTEFSMPFSWQLYLELSSPRSESLKESPNPETP